MNRFIVFIMSVNFIIVSGQRNILVDKNNYIYTYNDSIVVEQYFQAFDNCVAWYSYGTETVSNDTVTDIEDRALTNDLTQSTEAYRPTKRDSGWLFDLDDQLKKTGGVGITTGNFTICARVIFNDNSQNEICGQFTNFNNYWRFFRLSDKLALDFTLSGSTIYWQSDTNIPDDDVTVVSVVMDRTQSAKLYVNGILQDYLVDGGTDTRDINTGNFGIGKVATRSFSYITDVRLFDKALTDYERESNEQDLLNRYNTGDVTVILAAGQSNIDYSNQTITDSLPVIYNGDLPAYIFTGNQYEVMNVSVDNNNQYPTPANGWCWLTPFAYKYNELYSDSIYIVKFSLGGKALAVNTGTTDFNTASGELYDSVINVTNRALTKLEDDGKSYKVHYYVWHQGERDMFTTAYAQKYRINFHNYFSSLRRELSLPELSILGFRPNPDPSGYTQANIDTVQAVFTENSLKNYKLVNLNNFETAVGDGDHLTWQSAVSLGDSVATFIIKKTLVNY